MRTKVFLVGKDRSIFGKLPGCQRIRSRTEIAEAAAASTQDSLWVVPDSESADRLVQTLSTVWVQLHSPKKLPGLVMLKAPRESCRPLIHGLFPTIAGGPNFRWLPTDELQQVLSLSADERRDLFIGGMADPVTETLALTRGDLTTIIVPLSLFPPTPKGVCPDPNDFATIDCGHAIRLGDYEAATDFILYEVDAEYRRKLNARRRAEEKTFGAALRRLRKQRGLKRTDFPGVAAKTIARIERSESRKPHGHSLQVIADRLGVDPEEIEDY